MGKLVLVHSPPQKRMWKVVIDDRTLDAEDLLDWIRTSCSGDCVYTATRFADQTTRKHAVSNRKRNFDDGYLQYTFWFAKKADAALCRMFWEMVG